jgi:hypothetical protein
LRKGFEKGVHGEKKNAGVRTQKKVGTFTKKPCPPSFKLNGLSLIIILNLWTPQRVKHSTMEHEEECSAVCSKLTNENIQNY